MIISSLDNLNVDIELLTPQVHENMAIIPLKTAKNYNIDLLTLEKGIELGLVNVKECEQSQVNTLIVENRSVTPLILIDGEEVVGGDQNRIVSETIIIAPRSSMKIPVNCSEQGRWAYKKEFMHSDYIANYKTRRAKEFARRKNHSVQHTVWSSIHDVEKDYSFASPTSALSESYDNLRKNHNEIVKSFEIAKGQNGVLVIVDGEIKGFEVFLNSDIYKQFHEKIIKSYLIDSKLGDSVFAVNVDEAENVIKNATDSSFEKKETKGLEESYEFENDSGLGVISLYENEIIHWSYFKKTEELSNDEILDAELESEI
ncbi:ARPP-1 family domain-containing protein [Methanobrevibacter sp.]|uniref:ARPP-1 family domain-containing protein n=1 Tax=Methanobrevibacter sp. TaxID=66852 RepID=UPI00386FC23E